MPIKPILKLGDERLRKVCTPVTNVTEYLHVVADLKDTLAHVQTLYDFKRGSGLAAPQIGYLIRIAVVDYQKKLWVFINPEITNRSAEKGLLREGCLSFFNYRAEVPRHKSITVSALDESGKQFELQADDQFAATLQHELDHLDGILYFDHLSNGKDDLQSVEGVPEIP